MTRIRGFRHAAAVLLLLLPGWGLAQAQPATAGAGCSSVPLREHAGRNGALDADQHAMAQRAWRYFQNNTQASTGLVNAVDSYPSTTMWDTASYIGALVAAREFCLIDGAEFDRRAAQLLKTLQSLPLFADELPNKAYNTISAQKVNYNNAPGEIGYSALDLGRLLIWLRIVKDRYPQHADAVDRVVMRWRFCHAFDAKGQMIGAYVDAQGKTQYVQEGRLGYEEYAAKGFALWGFSVDAAQAPEPYDIQTIYGIDIPYDGRDPRKFYAHNYVVSESYVLDGLEMNWDLACDTSADDRQHSQTWMAQFAQCVYAVQETRAERTGILTARSEHQLDGPPYFVYDTVYSDGYAWNTLTEDGRYLPEVAAISLKAALGLWVLWPGSYTDKLYATIAPQFDPEHGYFEGLLENGKGPIRTFTANNNGAMLEALLYKLQGKLYRPRSDADSLWVRTRNDADARSACRAKAAAPQQCKVAALSGPKPRCVLPVPNR